METIEKMSLDNNQMENTKTRRIDYGCGRDHDVAGWRRNPESPCYQHRDMKHHAKVQILSSQLQIDYDVNLNLVSSDAMRPYMSMQDTIKDDNGKDILNPHKLAVLKILIDTIKTDRNPFTKKPFTRYGITQNVIEDIIRFEATGNKKAFKQFTSAVIRLNLNEIDVFQKIANRELGNWALRPMAQDVRKLLDKVLMACNQ